MSHADARLKPPLLTRIVMPGKEPTLKISIPGPWRPDPDGISLLQQKLVELGVIDSPDEMLELMQRSPCRKHFDLCKVPLPADREEQDAKVATADEAVRECLPALRPANGPQTGKVRRRRSQADDRPVRRPPAHHLKHHAA